MDDFLLGFFQWLAEAQQTSQPARRTLDIGDRQVEEGPRAAGERPL
jgi:hypothetical protein